MNEKDTDDVPLVLVESDNEILIEGLAELVPLPVALEDSVTVPETVTDCDGRLVVVVVKLPEWKIEAVRGVLEKLSLHELLTEGLLVFEVAMLTEELDVSVNVSSSLCEFLLLVNDMESISLNDLD